MLAFFLFFCSIFYRLEEFSPLIDYYFSSDVSMYGLCLIDRAGGIIPMGWLTNMFIDSVDAPVNTTLMLRLFDKYIVDSCPVFGYFLSCALLQSSRGELLTLVDKDEIRRVTVALKTGVMTTSSTFAETVATAQLLMDQTPATFLAQLNAIQSSEIMDLRPPLSASNRLKCQQRFVCLQ